MRGDPVGFEDFVRERSPALVRTAWLLTGDRHKAEDLVQATLVRVWPHWDRVNEGAPEAYVRTAMVRLHTSWWRRRWRGEVPSERIPEPGRPGRAGGGADDGIGDRLVLAAALARLPAAQRSAIVLRYVEDRSVEDVAAVLGCAQGTVKSNCARGLARLRDLLQEQPAEDAEEDHHE